MTEELDYKFIKNVLEKNNNKNFVKRILKKDDYGVLKNPDGTHSTHSMAYGSVGDKYVVFPTVVQDQTGNLVRLKPEQAWYNALNRNEVIVFESKDQAEWFSKNYKKYWDNE